MEQHVANLALFDDPSRIHDRDLVGDLRGDAQIVRHENETHAEFPLQLAQEYQHLNLHRRVERGRRLVGQQQAAAGRTRRSRSSRADAARRKAHAESASSAARARAP